MAESPESPPSPLLSLTIFDFPKPSPSPVPVPVPSPSATSPASPTTPSPSATSPASPIKLTPIPESSPSATSPSPVPVPVPVPSPSATSPASPTTPSPSATSPASPITLSPIPESSPSATSPSPVPVPSPSATSPASPTTPSPSATSPASPITLSPIPESSPSATSPPSPTTPSPLPQKGGSSVGIAIFSVVGVVVLVAVVALVAFLVMLRRRRRSSLGDESNLGTPHHRSSPFPLLESQRPFESKEAREEGNSNRSSSKTPREAHKLLPLQCRKAPAYEESLQLPVSQPHSRIHSYTTGSSSVSMTGENAQAPPLVSTVSGGVTTFTFQQLSEATNQFSEANFLGRGGFGAVYRGFLDGAAAAAGDVAIKQLESGSFQGEREFVTEINVISRVHHKNLVSLVGYCVSGTQMLLVYEYVENNNLAFHLQGRVAPVLDWPTRLSIALGAAKGIAYLHEECHPKIIHRDIKSANILLDSNLEAKVADFGLAKFVPDDKTHVTTRIMGSFGYLAPEFGSSGRLTAKSDVFSFGVVLLELITGRPPINLVEWASPILDQALEDGDFETQLIDPKLETNYDHEEMKGMVICAANSVHRFPDDRPRMSQVAQVLEGNISPEKLKVEKSRPGLAASLSKEKL